MEEILYQVCRDSKLYAEDTGDVVTIWAGEAEMQLEAWVCDPELKYWAVKNENEAQDPVFEMTPEEFAESFYIDAPEYGKKIYIRTACKWEVVK